MLQEYNSVKLNIKNLEKDLQTKSSSYSRMSAKVTSLNEDLQRLNLQHSGAIRSSLESEKQRYIANNTVGESKELQRVKAEYEELKKQLDEVNLTVNGREVREKLLSNLQALDSFDSTAETLEKLFIDSFGEQLYSALVSKSSNVVVEELSPEKLYDVLDEFTELSSNIQRISSVKVYDYRAVWGVLIFKEKWIDAICADDEQKRIVYLAYAVLWGALIYFLRIVIFAPLIVYMTVTSLSSYWRSRQLYKYMLTYLVCKGKRAAIDNYITSMVTAKIETLRKAKTKELRNKSRTLKKNMESSSDKLSQALITVGKRFGLDERLEQKIKEVEESKTKLLTAVGEQQNALQCLKLAMEEMRGGVEILTDKLNDIKNSILDTYTSFDKVGKEVIFFDEFVVGFNGDELSTIPFNKKATVIFYDKDDENLINLIQFFVSQIFCYMNAFLMGVTIADVTTGCAEFTMFQGRDDDGKKIDALYTELDTSESLTKYLPALMSKMKKIRSEALRVYNTLDEFNKYMISQDSLTYEYECIFFYHYPLEVLSNEAILQLCPKADKYGITPFFFIQAEEDGEEDKRAAQVYSKFLKLIDEKNFFYLSGSSLSNLPKDSVIESYDKAQK